jgi:hypothetical protein
VTPRQAHLLAAACAQVGIDPTGAELIRDGENQIYRLKGRIIARVNPDGQHAAAQREVFLARWLNDNGVRAVEPIDVAQPVEVDGHPVTFWHEFAPHHNGSVRQVATALKQLHALPVPNELKEHKVEPFVRLGERIDGATWVSDDDRDWLHECITTLENQWHHRPAGMPDAVIHGDAWVGNFVDVEGHGVTLLDLERCSVGPPEWDLTSTACRVTSYSTLTATGYSAYCDEYGYDVTTWAGFELFRDIRELRVTCYAAHVTQSRPGRRPEAQLRIDSLRGRRGPRPWRWEPVN